MTYYDYSLFCVPKYRRFMSSCCSLSRSLLLCTQYDNCTTRNVDCMMTILSFLQQDIDCFCLALSRPTSHNTTRRLCICFCTPERIPAGACPHMPTIPPNDVARPIPYHAWGVTRCIMHYYANWRLLFAEKVKGCVIVLMYRTIMICN